MDLPTSDLEDWRYVDCRPLATVPPRVHPRPILDPVLALIPRDRPSVLLIDGHRHPTDGPALPAGWSWTAANGFPAASDAPAAWALVQTARLTAQRSHDAPLTLVDSAAGGDSGWALELNLAAGTSAHLVLLRAALVPSRSSSWLRVHLSQGASLTIDDVQTTAAAQLLVTIEVELERDARCQINLAQTGGGLVRHRIASDLAGSGAEFVLRAATDVGGADQAHVLTRVIHRAGNTVSDQIAKAVLHDRARVSFDGVVTMLPGAAGAKAVQQDRNLLLSPEARADARPQLDIRVDDVEASHGATVGQLDAEELTYLRARGLPLAEANRLLTAGFLDESLLALRDLDARRIARQRLIHAI